jgi:serine phosphatase RsbU (regulator of sigma subunit)
VLDNLRGLGVLAFPGPDVEPVGFAILVACLGTIASMVKVAVAAQKDRAEHPAAVLAGMNETLCGRLGGQYVTAAYLFLDRRAGLMRYGAAGHPPMLRVGTRAPEVREVEQNGLALGWLDGGVG